MNTFTNGVANSDGIHEVWVDGKLIFQETNLKLMVTESSSMKIDDINIAHFYGGSSDDCKPLKESYGYIDNIVVYTPQDDPTFGTKKTHDPGKILETPSPIKDRAFYFDNLVTREGSLKNTQYGNTYSPAIDEANLIDAGAGNSIIYKLKWQLGGGDYLFFYDGNSTDSKLIRVVAGSSTESDQTITSSGRYLFVRFSTNTDAGSVGFTGTIAFKIPTVTVIPNNPPAITDQKFTLNETTLDSNFIGTIVASEPDPLQKLTFAILSGNESKIFTIDCETGDLQLEEGANIPDSATYELQVAVTDNAPIPATSSATIICEFLPEEISIPAEIPVDSSTMTVYPNPSTGEINILSEVKLDESNSDHLNTSELRILDISGKLLITKLINRAGSASHNKIDLSDLSDGTYFIVLQTGNVLQTEKVILYK
jgi:hypothetical protein